MPTPRLDVSPRDLPPREPARRPQSEQSPRRRRQLLRPRARLQRLLARLLDLALHRVLPEGGRVGSHFYEVYVTGYISSHVLVSLMSVSKFGSGGGSGGTYVLVVVADARTLFPLLPRIPRRKAGSLLLYN